MVKNVGMGEFEAIIQVTKPEEITMATWLELKEEGIVEYRE